MSEASKAVFLSYASQDADAARKICAALRVAGVEVWFDQSELRGGDAWDAKIRGQIASCALFVPIISANTQSRREGYFRLEWKLAAQRTHMMSERTAFLLPVVIDDTRDADADVPAEFQRAVLGFKFGVLGFLNPHSAMSRCEEGAQPQEWQALSNALGGRDEGCRRACKRPVATEEMRHRAPHERSTFNTQRASDQTRSRTTEICPLSVKRSELSVEARGGGAATRH
jgi:hypothetical protein